MAVGTYETLKNKAMKTRLLILLTAFLSIGAYCAGQELTPEKGENGKYGYIDTTGKEVISFKYDNAGNFYDGLALVELDGKSSLKLYP